MSRALRRLLLNGLIVVGVLALVCESLAVLVLIRTIAVLTQILTHMSS